MWRDPARPPLYRVLRDARGRGGGGRCGLQQLPALPGTVGAPAPPPPPAQGGNLRSQDEGRDPNNHTYKEAVACSKNI
ncbi:hypothetical protein JYU34_000766 [Plutella xylostella]|uniref:Uncharacterized protein n=1 Tax=Plutella xylostella TaxID=51655 RepID=A0ABQ7R8I6_PLUXY|nr:hypothetical protein JYU34_000766 [Plutella xylostella]